jgi:signal peptidase I
MDDKRKSEPAVHQKKTRIAEITDSFEWVITALILAFVFRAFVMEAFRIPTGSMADTLMGAHFRLCCMQCGYKYDYGFVPERYKLPADSMPRRPLEFAKTRCPSCGFFQLSGGTTPVAYGDRILVLKCIYEYFEPKRWDVIVFRDPLDPTINFIKRLAALPGETIEIIDGDVYINGQISRKPPKIQKELWMPVYDNDYQPARPREPFFNGHAWRQPFKVAGSQWYVDPSNATRFNLESSPEQINTMVYDTSIGNDFVTAYAYDDVKEYERMPFCSDLMVRYYVTLGRENGVAGITLSKYQSQYKARFEAAGAMVISRNSESGEFVEIARKAVKPVNTDKPIEMKFANVDHQLIFKVGGEELSFDMGREPNAAGPIMAKIEPSIQIFGAGKLQLSHVAIYRDIYYTNADGPGLCRGGAGNPFKLAKDEFFALGDNSPDSYDSRWWNQPGKGNYGKFYREGIVPRDYLVGKAMFVYWPSGYRPYPGFPVPVIPNVGRMRFVYGGK